ERELCRAHRAHELGPGRLERAHAPREQAPLALEALGVIVRPAQAQHVAGFATVRACSREPGAEGVALPRELGPSGIALGKLSAHLRKARKGSLGGLLLRLLQAAQGALLAGHCM